MTETKIETIRVELGCDGDCPGYVLYVHECGYTSYGEADAPAWYFMCPIPDCGKKLWAGSLPLKSKHEWFVTTNGEQFADLEREAGVPRGTLFPL